MLGANHQRWYVSLERAPGVTTARFGYESRESGHQVWDEMIWPLGLEELTEARILNELYTAVLDFISTRQ